MLELRGSFSIVVLSETEPDKLVAAKTATPLVLGLGDGENFVASDIPAILGHTRRTIVMEDGELAELTAHGVRLMTFDGVPIERAPRLIEWDAVAATKGGFQHYLRKEIAEQPQAWIDTLSGRAAAGSSAVRFEGELLPAAGPQAIGRIVMVSAGASWISSLIGKFMIEELCGVPAEVDYSAEFRYRQPPIDARTMMIAVSQSGETADTLAAMEEGRQRGCHLLALTNTVDSSIARKADAQLYTRCGPEISVTTTKCFLTQIEAFYLFAIHLAARLGRLSEREVERDAPAGLRDPGANQGSAGAARAPDRARRAQVRQGARLPLSRPRHQLPGRAGGRAQAQGDFLHPCRGLFGGRDEARADRAHRRGDAGGGDHPVRQRFREDAVEPARGRIAQRPHHRRDRPSARPSSRRSRGR